MKNTETLEYTNEADVAIEKRIAAYQLTDYLERLGVEVIFGFAATLSSRFSMR